MEELLKQKFNSDSEDEEYIPTKIELEESNEDKKKNKKDQKVIKSKVDAFWEKMKQKSGLHKENLPPKNSKILTSGEKIENEKEKEKKLEEEINNAIKKMKEQKEKTVTKEYFFAGQKFEEKKEITEKEIEKINKTKSTNTSSTSSKATTKNTSQKNNTKSNTKNKMEELLKQKFNSDSEDEEYIPTKIELEESNENKTKNKKDQKMTKSKVDAFWKKMKQKSGIHKENQPKNSKILEKAEKFENEKEKEKKLEEEINNAIKKLKEQKEKTVTKEYFFAGQKFEEKKEISEKEIEKINKTKSHNGIDSIIEDIRKKKNISTMDKSKKDWKVYVEEKQIEKELSQNRKDGFLGKKKFLDETNELVNEQQKLMVKKAKYAYELKQSEKNH